MKIALMLTGGVRGFKHAFRTWDWMMAQVTDTYYFCSPLQPDETPIESLIPNAQGEYVEDDPWVERYTEGRGVPVHDRPANSGHVAGPLMCCAIHNCFQRLLGHYDIVIRCRPDNFFGSGVSFESGLAQGPNAIWVPRFFSWGGYTDRFAFGGMDAMRVYSNFYFHLNDWTGEGEGVPCWSGNSETRLYHYLRKRCEVRRFDLRFCQVRADGSLRNNIPEHLGLFDFDGRPL
ncbi:MAG TPA: hypothetical protein VHM90_17940 [Phycisphaerae bacterium]|nr:hypothetical protein [Phycisphaerae bacterium]